MRALNSLVQCVAATIERHGMLAPGQRVGVAVSGGADSVCMLHVLRELSRSWKFCLTVLHLDHQLRGEESRADAAFVREMAERLGVPLVSKCAVLPGGNLEQEARRARLAFFAEAIGSGTVERVAVGHTRSDQAETVLFRFLRGAGTAGLSGIRPVTTEGLVRPLIEVDRAEVESYLRERSTEWREDSTNASRRFARNRIRHELLPQLGREWNPEIVRTLTRTADWARAEEEYWEQEIDSLEAGRLVVENGSLLLKASAVMALPAGAARRLIRRAMERGKGDLRGVDFRHVDEVLRLAGQDSGTGRVQAEGLEIRRSFDWLRFDKSGNDWGTMTYRLPAAVPGRVEILPGGPVISLELIEKTENSCLSECVYNDSMGCVDWERLAGSLTVRNWMAGDRYQPSGSISIRKLKTLFQLARIPVWERRRWPVLVDGDSIVWTRQFGVASEFAAGPRTRIALRVQEIRTA
jgi:tRNA(Ile)-lysidine synthase